tara:strand:- start:5417 stop:5632 length:216 start_codon:yes stop_codon:yes gene_type:complete
VGKIEYWHESEVIKNFVLVKVNKAFKEQLENKSSNIISTEYSCFDLNIFKFYYLLNWLVSLMQNSLGGKKK